MGLRLRHVRLRAQTESGLFGADVPFSKGLNVLWADNTKGKSTTLQAVIYALGFEKMFGASADLPLPYAMTSYVEEDGSTDHPAIIHSAVWLEIENAVGEIVTVRRRVRTEGSVKLITVFFGPALTGSAALRSQDYYVLDPGAATREVGFHSFLASFVGWELPIVSRYNGLECPLYMEALFPLFYVEQKSGWSEIPAAFPTQFGIRELDRRAVEFILALHTHENELERQRLIQEVADLKASWLGQRQELVGLARAHRAEIERLPSAADTAFEEMADVVLSVDIHGQSLYLDRAVTELTARIRDAQDREIPTSSDVAPEVTGRLEALTQALAEQTALRASILRDQALEQAQLGAVLERLAAIDDDLQKNKDVQKLQAMGSKTAAIENDHLCPTCDQPIEDTLLPQGTVGVVMSIDDNIAYLSAQRALFVRMADQSRAAVAVQSRQIGIVDARISETAAEIRLLRADLIAPGNAPSESAIGARLRDESRLFELNDLREAANEKLEALRELAAEFSGAKLALQRLPKDNLSVDDRNKLEAFLKLVREQLGQYGFSTFSPSEISLSDNYRLEKEGFLIRFQASASDGIRLKWAYQLGLLEVARTRPTNHLGLVIFDEPRQQEAAKASFEALLRRAAAALEYNQQVIFATSEDRSELERFLEGLPVNFNVFEGWMIKRIDDSGSDQQA
ncbi:hypothetical protein [Sphingosinicella sp. LY1275]|uniref:hypothetical protein n=1 Tax=Sphingosinicella sp. LY1275 TaxID=3095379 RepID=UPI002ADEF2C2|nr:hypothetical protein [Sphingosinicella sp. LY1275]MEA1013899.1 hypothetical protein [Sphingosinicella sp. LY1275]